MNLVRREYLLGIVARSYLNISLGLIRMRPIGGIFVCVYFNYNFFALVHGH